MQTEACSGAQLGLRERKKAATRAALGIAAMRLATERGVANVTADDIAAAVNVSPRTFHNYFSSKEEAIVAPLVDRAVGFAEALRARPADESIWDSLRHVTRSMFSGSTQESREVIAFLQELRRSPALVAQHLTVFEHMSRALSEIIAERTGTDMRHQLYPHLQAAAAPMAIKACTELWAEGEIDTPLPELLDQAFTQLSAGIPRPGAVPLAYSGQSESEDPE